MRWGEKELGNFGKRGSGEVWFGDLGGLGLVGREAVDLGEMLIKKSLVYRDVTV